jgi:hypothetical protein
MRVGLWRRVLCWLGAHEGYARDGRFFCVFCSFSRTFRADPGGSR